MNETKIQWADTTNNLQMGCEGCELVKGQDRARCYAKTLTDRYQGRKGWPKTFEQPKIFPERLAVLKGLKDLRGANRPDKPWLNGSPRFVFLNDMGDTFSKGMPEEWFAEFIPELAATPHIYLVLTKWPQRFAKFSKKYKLPKNVCPGTTITSEKTLFRADQLKEVVGGGFKWFSLEPLWSFVPLEEKHNFVSWIIFGGESGIQANKCDTDWISKGIEFCLQHNISPFVKQLGSNPIRFGEKLRLADFHGGDWNEWPQSLRVRKIPFI